MFLELIATFIAGFAAAGVAIALRKFTGGRLPVWLVPIVAGGAMIGVAIWSEYTWFDRTIENLPEGIELAESNASSQLYRPWTYIVPLEDRFIAVDVGTMQSHEAQPDQFMADLYLWERWRPIVKYPALFDCAGSRRALVPADATYGSDGTVEGAIWNKVPGDDPVLSTACKEG